jgi:hypothetical protein
MRGLSKLLPPIHILYLTALAAILASSYFSRDYERSTWALIVLLIAPLLLIATTIVVWRKASQEHRRICAIYVWTLLLSLAAANLYLEATTISQETKVGRILRERNNDPSTLTALLPQALVNVEPVGSFSLRGDRGDEFLPLADVSNSRTVYCREAGDYLIYRSDEKGFHNPPGIWSGGVDIAMIGDSYVHGACVPDGSDFPSLVRRKYSRTVNLGRGGNGPLSNLAILSEYASAAQPQLVIWFHVDNDLRDLRSEEQSAILMNYVSSETTHNLANRTAEIDRIVRAYLEGETNERAAAEQLSKVAAIRSYLNASSLRKELAFSALRDRLLFPRFGAHNQVLLPSDEDITDLDWPLYEQSLSTAKQRVEGWGGRMIVMMIPFQKGYGFLDPNDYEPAKAYRNRLVQIFGKLGLSYYDMNDVFHRLRDPNSYLADMHRYYGHENEAGYRVLADITGKYIEHVCGPQLPLSCRH